MIGLGIGLGLGHVQRGGTGGGGEPTPAPVFSVQPTMTPTSGTAGETVFTASNGTASNATAYARRWLLSGTAIGTGAMVIPAEAGSLVLEVTATGPGGSTIATSAASTVEEAGEPEIPEGRRAIRTSYHDRPFVMNQRSINDLAIDLDDPAMHQSTGTPTHTLTRNGDYHDATAWSVVPPNAAIPNSMDHIVDVGDYELTINANCTFKNMHVGWKGALRVEPANNLPDILVTCQLIMCHGRRFIKSLKRSDTIGGMRIQFLFQRVDDFATLKRPGFFSMSGGYVWGAPAKAQGACDTALTQGATSAIIPGAYGFWRQSDRLYIPSPKDYRQRTTDSTDDSPEAYIGIDGDSSGVLLYQDASLYAGGMGYPEIMGELVTIVSVDANNLVTWSEPLSHARPVFTRTLDNGHTITRKPEFHHENRNICFRSASATNLNIATFMAMGTGDDYLKGFQTVDMGGTRVDPTLPSPLMTLLAADGVTDLADETNSIGWYGLHIHRFGQERPLALEDVVVKPSGSDVAKVLPGRGIVAHHSRVNALNCYVRGRRNTGMWWEDGKSIGQAVKCFAAVCPGIGYADTWGTIAEKLRDFGDLAGIAYGCQSRQIGFEDCGYADVNYGWRYLQNNGAINTQLVPADKIDAYNLVPEFEHLVLANPVTWGGNSTNPTDTQQNYERKGAAYQTYGIEQAIPPFFRGSYGYSSFKGFSPAHRRFVDRFDGTMFPMVGWETYGCHHSWIIEHYSHLYGVGDVVALRADSTYEGTGLGRPVAFTVISPTWGNVFGNMAVENYLHVLNASGADLHYNGYIYNVQSSGIASQDVLYQTLVGPHGYIGTADWRDAPAANLQGQMVSQGAAGTYPVLTRPQVINTTAQFPLTAPKEPYGPPQNPEPGKAKPYTTSTSTDRTLDMNGGRGQCSIGFTVTDELNTYKYSDTQNLTDGAVAVGNRPINCEPEVLLARNGCYQEGGEWKMFLPYAAFDRPNEKHFLHDAEVLTLTNTAGHEELLAFYEKPNKQYFIDQLVWAETGEILPEAQPAQSFTPHTAAAPLMVDKLGYVLRGDEPLTANLRSNDPYTRFSLKADAEGAKFRIVWVRGIGKQLQFIGGVSRDEAFPGETLESYSPTIILTNPYSGAFTKEVMEIALESATATATSLSLWSEDLSNAHWSATGSVTANAGVAPDGATTADLLIAAGGYASIARAANYAFNLVNNPDKDIITCTIAVKRSTAGQQPYIQINTGGGATAYFFDLDTGGYAGLIDLAGANETATTLIENLGGGWYRLTVTVRCVANTNFYFGHGDTVLSRDATNGRSMLMWGALVYEYPAALLPYRKATGVPANLYLP